MAGLEIVLKEWRHSSAAAAAAAGEIGPILDQIGWTMPYQVFENGDIPWVKSDKDLWLRVEGTMLLIRMRTNTSPPS